MRPFVTIFLRARPYRSNARSGRMADGGPGGPGGREAAGERALGSG